MLGWMGLQDCQQRPALLHLYLASLEMLMVIRTVAVNPIGSR